MMNGNEVTLAVIDALEALSIPYMLVGSLSSNVYGVERSTHDADFVVQISNRSVRDITNRLGPSFRLDQQSSFETVTLTLRHNPGGSRHSLQDRTLLPQR